MQPPPAAHGVGRANKALRRHGNPARDVDWKMT